MRCNITTYYNAIKKWLSFGFWVTFLFLFSGHMRIITISWKLANDGGCVDVSLNYRKVQSVLNDVHSNSRSRMSHTLCIKTKGEHVKQNALHLAGTLQWSRTLS